MPNILRGNPAVRRGALRAVIYGAAAFALSSNATAAEPIVMRVAFPAPETSLQAQGAYVMEQYIERSLPGQVDVQVYPGSKLIGQTRLIPAIQRGGLEATLVDPTNTSKQVATASIFNAAYLKRDLQHSCTILRSGFGRDLVSQMEEVLKVNVLAYNYLGTRTLALAKPRSVKTPEDLTGMKLREPGMALWQFLGSALGATPTPIPYSEIYLAMQTGTVDAFELELSNIMPNALHEVTEQIVLTKHIVSLNMLAVSKSFWGTLNDEQKSVVEDGARLFAEFNAKNRIRAEARAIEELKATGIKITSPDTEAFRAFAKEKYLNSEYAKKWPSGLFEKVASMPADPDCTLY